MTKTIAFSWVQPLNASSGGVERVTLRLMEGLNSRGYRCLFLLHDVKRGQFVLGGREFASLQECLISNCVDVLINQNGYSSELTRAVEKADWPGRYIVCFHSEPFYLRKIFDLSRLLSELSRRDCLSQEWFAWLLRLLTYPIWRAWSDGRVAKAQSENYRVADRYVVLSSKFAPGFLRMLRSRNLPKLIAIPNPLSLDINSDEVRRWNKQKEVLIVARLNDAEKRISTALKAWRLVEKDDPGSWVLKIIGDGPDANDLRKMSEQIGLRRVMFLGKCDPVPHYMAASILLMTSRVEGWGLALTEAMQTGTVVVAFDAYASLTDIIDHDVTGIIVPNNDLSRLATETKRLMDSPSRRLLIAEKALVASQRYRLEAVLDDWCGIL